MGLPEPVHQFPVQLRLPRHRYMVGPAVGIGLHSHSNAGGLHPAGQPKGEQQAPLRPALPPPGQRGSGVQAPVIKADLCLLHLDPAVGKGRIQPPEQRLVHRQLRRPPLKKGLHVRLIVFRRLHRRLPLRLTPGVKPFDLVGLQIQPLPLSPSVQMVVDWGS